MRRCLLEHVGTCWPRKLRLQALGPAGDGQASADWVVYGRSWPLKTLANGKSI